MPFFFHGSGGPFRAPFLRPPRGGPPAAPARRLIFYNGGMKAIAVSALLFLLPFGLSSRTAPDALKSLVAAETSFASMAEQKGINEAFLAYLAEGSIILDPVPVDARARYSAPDKDTGLLGWAPEIAGVSAAGDLGWTSGPFEYRKEKTDEKPIATGHYVTVWRRQADGSWKVALDTGISHPLDGGLKAGHVVAREIPFKGKAPAPAALEREKAALLEREKQFSPGASKSAGDLPGLMAEDVRMYRNGKAPVIGREAAANALGGSAALFQFNPHAAVLSASGDLAYSYGIGIARTAEGNGSGTEKFSYLHIWERRKDGAWAVILDLAVPIPPTIR
jgi:ketosteroid isomerase-like protein